MIPQQGPFFEPNYRLPFSPSNYGVIADGALHPLSERYVSLAQAQADYPFVTALTQQIDWAACQLASDSAFGRAGREHGAAGYLNHRLHCLSGQYMFGNDTWVIRNLVGGWFFGDWRLATIFRGNKVVIYIDGLWYSHIGGFSVERLVAGAAATDAFGTLPAGSDTGTNLSAAMVIDGNVPGHPYDTRGVQASTISDILVDGGGSAYALAVGYEGASGAQGDQCIFANPHLQNASFACFGLFGLNFLSLRMDGGNMQNYDRNGIYMYGSTMSIRETAFQALRGYEQIANGGFDINCGDNGDFTGIIVDGCRSESMRFLRNAGAVQTSVRGCNAWPGTQTINTWFASTQYGIGSNQGRAVLANDANGQRRLFVKQNAGIHTSGASEPTWPMNGSTVVDGGITWQEVEYFFIDMTGGTVERETCFDFFGAGKIRAPFTGSNVFRAASGITNDDGYPAIFQFDCTAGNAILNLKDPPIGSGSHFGRPVTVKKLDTSANTVTINSAAGFEDGTNTMVIPGGSRGYRNLYFGQAVGEVNSWITRGSG